MKYRSLRRSDPEFLAYVLGTFSKTDMAIPEPSLNPGLASDEVLFRIQPRVRISRPWHRIFKMELWVWSLFPLGLLLLLFWIDGRSFDPWMAALATLTAIFFQTAAQLWNDFRDHLVGFDHIHPARSEKPVQRGWITAHEVRKGAWIFLGLGLLTGSPIAWSLRGQELAVVGLGLAVIATLFVFGISRMGYRFSHWAELLSFLLFGPLLTMSFELGVSRHLTSVSFFVGVFSGLLALFFLQIRNFENVLVLSQAKMQNLVTVVGFDRSKFWMKFLWLTSLSFGVLIFWHRKLWIWSPMAVAYFVYLTVSLFRNLKAISSPLGSGISNWGKLARGSSLKVVAFVLAVCLMEILFLELR